MATENDKLENEKFLSDNKTDVIPSEPSLQEGKSKVAIRLQWLVRFLAVLTVSLLLGLLVVTAVWYSVRVKDLEPKEHEICLNCSELKGKHDEGNVLEGFKKNNDECCGTTSQILKRLVDKNTLEKYRNDLANNFFGASSKECNSEDRLPEKPSAKVAGISFMDMEKETSSLNIVHWNNSGPGSFLKPTLRYVDGKLRIQQPGFYYVFSQLQWFLNSTETLPVRHEVIQHSYNLGVYVTLLESQKSKCNLVEDSGEITSSIGALFELGEGDKIFVTTSKPDRLSASFHGNFFGLYLVADPVQIRR